MKSRLRKFLFGLHLWFGLTIGLYLTLIGATGAVLVWFHEIVAIQWPEMHQVAPPTSDALPLSLSEIYAAVHRAFPDATPQELAGIDLPERPGGAYHLHLNAVPDPMQMRIVTINPYTGGVIHDTRLWDIPFGKIMWFHMYLFLGLPGMVANSVGGAFAAVLLSSGVWLWWPRTAGQIRSRLTMARGASFRRRLHDLHNLFGIYALPALIVVVLTGTMFGIASSVEKGVYAVTNSPAEAGPPVVTAPAGAKRLPVETLVAAAEKAVPNGAILNVSYPTEASQPLAAFGEYGKTGFLPYYQVYIDPYTGQTLKVDADADASLGRRVMRTLSSLHFGWWGGLTTKILYTAFGLVPLGLLVTGVLKYAERQRAKIAVRQKTERATGDRRRAAPAFLSAKENARTD